MHPILATPQRFLLYLLAWLPIGGLVTYLLGFSAGLGALQASLVALPLCAIYAFICLSPWYLCRVLPVGPGRIVRILQSHLAAGTIASFLWIITAKGWSLLLSRWDASLDSRVSHQLPMIFIVGELLYMLAVSLHYVLLSFQISRDAEVQTQAARMLAREAELKALKAQINPHFLFNSLNSISALTSSEPAKAREMCILLSDFLRSTLSLGDKETILLADELELTRTYLGVEQVRFGSRLRIEESIGAECGKCRVPPLLLQPLVENAIKHGVAGRIDGSTVRLTVNCEEGRLRLRVENEFDVESPAAKGNNMGLVNVRRRLLTRFADGARLDTRVVDDRFLVEINVPCERAG